MADANEPSKSALKKAEKQAKQAAAKAGKAAKQAALPVVDPKKADDSKEIIGITVSKNEHFSQWYQELVIKAELVEYYTEVREKSARLPHALRNLRLLTFDGGTP